MVRWLKKNHFLVYTFAFLLVLLSGCGEGVSPEEAGKLDEPVFVAENSMTSVSLSNVYLGTNYSTADSIRPLNPISAQLRSDLMPSKRCFEKDIAQEADEVLALAREAQQRYNAGEDVKLIIPVLYAISFGDKFDDTAKYALERAALRLDRPDKKSFVYRGDANQFKYTGSSARHYIVDFDHAIDAFTAGERCFVSYVVVDEEKTGQVSPIHGKRIMYYGDKYTGRVSGETEEQYKERVQLSPRLFDKVENLDFSVNLFKEDMMDLSQSANWSKKNFVPLYLADFRDELVGDQPLINTSFTSSRRRRFEYRVLLREIFNIDVLWHNYNALVQALSTPHDHPAPKMAEGSFSFGGYGYVTEDGTKRDATQLMEFISMSALSGTVLSTQYTPLVLDLGSPHIRTSSLEWGTYFNAQNLSANVPDGLTADNVMEYVNNLPTNGDRHMTAWLGGEFVQDESSRWTLRADDGFLVTPAADGLVHSGAQLFGDQRLEEGKLRGTDGFVMLQEFAGKDCNSLDKKDRYVGPWDGDVYFDKLAVWIDANRDGKSELDEIKKLSELGVAAINTCYIVSSTAEDQFGNRTDMRSAFLLVDDFTVERGDLDQEAEILNRLNTGKTSSGTSAEFRVMIDVVFKSDTKETLYGKKELKSLTNIVPKRGEALSSAVGLPN